MPKDSVIPLVAQHDRENRRPDSPAEEAELQARIAKNLKPLDAPPVGGPPVMPTPGIAAQLAPQPEREAQMPDGTPIPAMTREHRLEMALRNLVAKLDEMAADASFKEVWKVATSSGVKYTGPIWKPEVDWARTLLK